MKKTLLFFLIISNLTTAQVSNVIRNEASYTQEIFPYRGIRMMQVDEVSCPENEENVFIFSKIEKNAKKDIMYFQRFTKISSKWKLNSDLEIKHDGIISVWKSRKAFLDTNKDKSIDALFIYSLNDYEFKQQTVHLIFSHLSKIYSIYSNISDNYSKDTFSDNFKELDENSKSKILEYWNKLDKADN